MNILNESSNIETPISTPASMNMPTPHLLSEEINVSLLESKGILKCESSNGMIPVYVTEKSPVQPTRPISSLCNEINLEPMNILSSEQLNSVDLEQMNHHLVNALSDEPAVNENVNKCEVSHQTQLYNDLQEKDNDRPNENFNCMNDDVYSGTDSNKTSSHEPPSLSDSIKKKKSIDKSKGEKNQIKEKKEFKEKRDKISLKDKERLVKAHDAGADFIDLGDKMGINRHTVHSIITLWRKSGVLSRGRVGGHKKHMITDEVGTKLIQFVEQNPLHTLKEMKEYMEYFGISPTVQTISNYMHGKCIAIRNTDYLSQADRNSEEIKSNRYSYVKNILDNNISMKQCIFVDECMFNFWIRSPYGKYTKGTRDYKHCCGQKETNVTVCMAVATTGVVHYKVCFGPLSKSSFEEFILELSMQLGDGYFYIIQESTPTHTSVVPAFENHQMVFLPQYSYFLNPLTGVFEKLKNLVKDKVPTPHEVVKLGMTARKEMLKRVVEEVIPANFYCSMNTFYSTTVKYFSKCIFKEDICLD